MTGAVLHKSPAQIALGELPSPGEVGDAIADVDRRIEQLRGSAAMAEHGGRLRPDLHEPDLADAADRIGIVGALDLHDRVGDVRRQAALFGFLPDSEKMRAAPARKRLRQADQAGDGRRQRNLGNLRSGGLGGQGRARRENDGPARDPCGESGEDADHSAPDRPFVRGNSGGKRARQNPDDQLDVTSAPPRRERGSG
jgi:hypothetical protein